MIINIEIFLRLFTDLDWYKILKIWKSMCVYQSYLSNSEIHPICNRSILGMWFVACIESEFIVSNIPSMYIYIGIYLQQDDNSIYQMHLKKKKCNNKEKVWNKYDKREKKCKEV